MCGGSATDIDCYAVDVYFVFPIKLKLFSCRFGPLRLRIYNKKIFRLSVCLSSSSSPIFSVLICSDLCDRGSGRRLSFPRATAERVH